MVLVYLGCHDEIIMLSTEMPTQTEIPRRNMNPIVKYGNLAMTSTITADDVNECIINPWTRMSQSALSSELLVEKSVALLFACTNVP